jgi:hypothetical protein
VLQYLRSTTVLTPEYVHDTGLISAIETDFGASRYQIQINNGCLEKTAYDIAGGSLSGSWSGLFSGGSFSGNVPTAAAYAYVNSEHPNDLTIESGHSNSINLHFTGADEGQELIPADQQTRNVLDTYGCRTGVAGLSRIDAQGMTSSPYIH